MTTADPNKQVPLVVDIDGTLLNSDVLYESIFAAIAADARHAFGGVKALIKGKARLKSYFASAITMDYAILPYNGNVLVLLQEAKAAGRQIFLASACNRIHAERIADYLGCVDGVFASDESVNLSGIQKAERLLAAFGSKGFDYLGDSRADLPVWREARKAYVVDTGGERSRWLRRSGIVATTIGGPRATVKAWLYSLRIHQYAKNVLIFVPSATAHAFNIHQIVMALLAFADFCLCASSVYLLNDLIDLASDRRHPNKRGRGCASGLISIPHATLAVPLLLIPALACSLLVSLKFLAVLLIYLVLTLGYSLFLKRKMLVDVLALALLYTIRVIAGGVAIRVHLSEWLLAFSLFMFTCLALVKRYVELTTLLDKRLSDPTNRNYRLNDIPIIGALAATSGMNAVTVFALYISSDAVKDLYRRPEVLWLACPLLVYWIARIILLAGRRMVHDDPVVFALRDRNSLVAGALMIAILFAAA